MPAIIAAVVAWLARVFVGAFSLSRIWTLIVGVLRAGWFTVGMPLAINWGLFKVGQKLAPAAISTLGLSSHTVTVLGLGGWIAGQMQLPLCFSVLMGFVAQRATMSMVRMAGPLGKYSPNRISH